MKLMLTFLIMTAAVRADVTVIGADLVELSTYASINIPLNPNNASVSMRDDQWASRTFMVEVTGGAGTGYLGFIGDEYAESFSGSPFSEYMESYSGISFPVGNLYTPGWTPQGSTSASCYWCLGIAFTFDTPEEVTITAYSSVAYSYYPMQPGSWPFLAGNTISSSASIYGPEVFDNYGPIDSAVVTFSEVPTPEPAGFAKFSTGILLLFFLTPRRRFICA
jgi:hypothetical protein